MPLARIERKAPADPALGIRRAVSHFGSIGYQGEPATYGAAQLGFPVGKRAAPCDAYTLRILHEGALLVFEFSTGLGESGAVPGSDLKELEKRVDASLRAGPGGGSKVGCRFCGQITDSAAAACEACGSTDFL